MTLTTSAGSDTGAAYVIWGLASGGVDLGDPFSGGGAGALVVSSAQWAKDNGRTPIATHWANGPLDERQIKEDSEKIYEYYQKNGYNQAQVSESTRYAKLIVKSPPKIHRYTTTSCDAPVRRTSANTPRVQRKDRPTDPQAKR